MITADPQARATRLNQVLEILGRDAAAADRELLLAFARPVLASMPDRLALGLPPEALAARIREHQHFVVREMPPAFQLYRGLPGIHVWARNPDEAEARRMGSGDSLPLEHTLVEVHTVDAPFIFESLKNYFQRAGLQVFASIHPIFCVRRQWERIVWIGDTNQDGSRELLCHFQVERVDSKERLRRIEHEIHAVLKSVLTAVEDFPAMVRAVRELGPRLRPRSGTAGEAEAARAFLDWLQAENYIFIGTLRYRIEADGRPGRVDETATGVFTDPALLPVVFPGLMEEQESQLLPIADDHRIVDIDYCNRAQAIHHLDPIDDIMVREWGEDGRLNAVTLLVGRLAKGAFTEKAEDIPLLREKQRLLLERSGAKSNSYAYREIRAVFNRFPKRELLYAGPDALKDVIDRIVYMTGDDEIVVHTRAGLGYVALSIAFSHLRHSYRTEENLRRALAETFGPISFGTSADLGATTLLLFYFDAGRLERPLEAERVREITRELVTTWEDRAASALQQAFGERDGRRLLLRYIRQETRSGLYREATPPEEVPSDIRHLESLEGRLEVSVLPRNAERVTLKLYHNDPLGLTATLRTLQNFGLQVVEEMRVPLALPEERKGFLYRLDVEAAPARIAALVAGEERFARALRALDERRATDDPLNGLILDAGLTWREVEVLRTLRNHLLQIRPHYNVETVNGVLLRNSAVSEAIYRSFATRFDPALVGERATPTTDAQAAVQRALESVRSLAEDEVLRAIDNLVRAALRTNAFQLPERPVFSIKVDSRKVEGMPSPRPMFEIYVHSRLLEGIHLRGGKVARGGIRWSDRHDDFRTEILGLMKTQMVKNAVIVPVGSKGGFVLKGNVPSRPALDDYLIDRYREFISGLLDVTDNVVDGRVVHPPDVVFHDGEDPYLVVAADKGTAHLSDTANSVSAQYGFWLGDAFASGGSAGYDHKKMAITARGAWECVRHHFANLGTDIQTQPFTTVGIGDMSGDVFGNGALLSPVLRLVAAFNHAHIFIDPDPDLAISFRERQRLFDLPRSSWRDYDPALISRGGGVFDRSAKAIPLSPEIKHLLEIPGDSASGEEVIRRILSAGVDLLYNGGIGTYVKSAAEDDADVGDRANDRVRINGADLRAKVVGEGGNLGFTQRGRLEYWGRGGNINTDAIDNSGGVDTSDHEVNIKILLDPLVRKAAIKDWAERNRILAEMTEEVAALVLGDNQGQARCLTLDGIRSAAKPAEFVALIEDMLGAGVLSRSDDAIPSRDELLASADAQRGLPRPLLCVLLGHAKNWAFEMLLETDFPDSAAGRPLLDGYFPQRLQGQFRQHFQGHALKREIIATVAVNQLINSAGATFLSRTMATAKTGLGEIVSGYLEAERASGAADVRKRVLAAGMGSRREHEALLALEAALEAATLDAIAGRRSDPAAAVAAVAATLPA